MKELQERLEAAQKQREDALAALEAANGMFTKALEILSGDDVTEKQITEAEDLEAKAEKRKAVAEKALASAEAQVTRLEKELEGKAKPVMPVPIPVPDNGDGAVNVQTAPGAVPRVMPDGDDFDKSVHLLRYTTTDLTKYPFHELCQTKAMMELYGADYRQIDTNQREAFGRYLRGKGSINLDDDRVLRRVYWPIAHTAEMLKDGMTIEQVKSTMIEGADVLGGYAVPPERSNEILKRAMGLTAVRRAGAMVIQTASKVIEWLKLTGGGDLYPTGMRGYYGSETQSPVETSFTWGLIQIPVHIYTYKVPFSVSSLEDVQNIEQVFTNLVAETLAIDEDRDFLVGDGANKARGILPGQANPDNLTEVVTGDADNLKYDGLKKLRRGIASQYRMAGGYAFIGNNQSGEDIELFKDAEGRYFFDVLTPGGRFLGGSWYESESLPDPAGSAFPIIFGNMSGYAIVERLGLTIQRYNDSNTGPNVVEFHIRRRIGGRVIEPWKFAVQKVSAT